MEKITSILAKKEPHFHTVTPGSSADTALSRMCHENVDYLIVMDDGKYVGLLTEHDIASKVVITNRQLTKTKVSDIMNKQLPAATTDDTVETCMQLMRQHHVRYLPVFEIHSFRGIVSSEDILEEAVNNRMEIFDAVVRRDSRFGCALLIQPISFITFLPKASLTRALFFLSGRSALVSVELHE
jgi:CBS domain-containing protein